jgi:serine/threonine-protein kinase RsbT
MGNKPVPVSIEDHVDIVDADDVIAARQKGRMLAAEIGFSPAVQAMLAAVISELARNIVDYAGRGEVLFHVIEDDGRRGIAVVARDHGPGIPNIEEALQASRSVAGGLGLGLRGVKAIMDGLDIVSVPGKGTTVTARKWQS